MTKSHDDTNKTNVATNLELLITPQKSPPENTEKRRTCLLVLGMHRSGTSTLTRVLNIAGAKLPSKLIGSGEGNNLGHWEPLSIIEYHDSLLRELDSSWDDWQILDLMRLPIKRREEISEDIKGLITAEYGRAPLYVLKDPRICRFTPFYIDLLQQMETDVYPILTFRNPLEVCESLEKRDNIKRADAALLWLRHVLDSEKATRDLPRTITTYHNFLKNWRTGVKDIAERLNPSEFHSIDEIESQVDDFVNPNYRNHYHKTEEILLDPALRDWMGGAYEALLILEHNPKSQNAFHKLDHIAAEFDSVSPVLNRLYEEVREDRSAALADFQVKITHSENHAEELSVILEKREKQISELETTKFEAQNRATKQTNIINSYKKQVTRLEKSLSQVKNKKTKISATLEDKTKEAKRQFEKLFKLNKKTIELTSSLFRKKEEMKGLKSALGQAKKKNRRLENAYTSEKDGFAARLLDYGKELAQEQNNVKELKNRVSFNLDNLHLARASLEEMNKQFRTSTSWRITAPIRAVKTSTKAVSRFIQLAPTATCIGGGILQTTIKALRILQNEGVVGVRLRMEFAESKSHLFNQPTTSDNITQEIQTTQEIIFNKPLVSVIIPVYDRTSELREAINSILQQTFQDFELIIVTDGSPPETLNVLEEYDGHEKIRVFMYPNQSGTAVRGRNKGILESRGKYIAFLDSDDCAASTRLELSIAPLEANKADVVYGNWRAIIDGSRIVPGIEHGQIVSSPSGCTHEELLNVSIPCQSTVVLRRSLFEKNGLLKPEMKYREDHELWVRLSHNGARFSGIQKVLCKLRLHEGNNELNFKKDDDYWYQRLLEVYKRIGPTPKKVAFILPGVGIGGGVAIVFKHAQLIANAGHDVMIIDIGHVGFNGWYPDNNFPIVNAHNHRLYLFENIDLLIATGWQTAGHLDAISAKRKAYFVQSDERRFTDNKDLKMKISETYKRDCEYFTEAHWIQRWLESEFNHSSHYVPNGLDPNVFHPNSPLDKRSTTKPRILIEGPVDIPFKGVADAYKAVHGLNCEIWLVSSAGRPPSNWKIDRFFEKAPFEEMHAIYSSCDIFLKMSKVEGFFGPPMEAMSCGCAVVVGEVTGRDEFIEHEYNALVVEQGDIKGARLAVKRLLTDTDFKRELTTNGFTTAREWTWEKSSSAMLDFIENTN